MKYLVNNNLNFWRKKNGKTQIDVAEAIGVTRQTIISMEKGNYIPSVLLALRLAKYFNIKVEDLFTLEI